MYYLITSLLTSNFLFNNRVTSFTHGDALNFHLKELEKINNFESINIISLSKFMIIKLTLKNQIFVMEKM
ncbi:MAG: Unknown protein [uncultured Sulfurovum sp.]|uniref:Uncharacterized protein n=1 Tax=uncultured Sulfurovum sp. TaxID=269237 RepID=A0A6S6T2U5_9BACT|nr:MAG: Unknown protein [uncultured Sulfurovum sp.]